VSGSDLSHKLKLRQKNERQTYEWVLSDPAVMNDLVEKILSILRQNITKRESA
jgi:hypothetical protein